jgi:predicted transcriptional regulator
MTTKPRVLTDLELEIMKIVWGLEKATVRDVYEELNKRRKIAYTTVMTMMRILEQKKHLKKSQRDRAYVYHPSRPKKEVVQKMVREFVNRVFNGSAEPLLVHLVEDSYLSEQTLKEVAQTLEKKP